MKSRAGSSLVGSPQKWLLQSEGGIGGGEKRSLNGIRGLVRLPAMGGFGRRL